jgi:hypothetical protein
VQYEELDQQALIYKYLVARVPRDLAWFQSAVALLPRNSLLRSTHTYGVFLPLPGGHPCCIAFGCLLRPRACDSLFIPINCVLPRYVNLLWSFVNRAYPATYARFIRCSGYSSINLPFLNK